MDAKLANGIEFGANVGTQTKDVGGRTVDLCAIWSIGHPYRPRCRSLTGKHQHRSLLSDGRAVSHA